MFAMQLTNTPFILPAGITIHWLLLINNLSLKNSCLCQLVLARLILAVFAFAWHSQSRGSGAPIKGNLDPIRWW